VEYPKCPICGKSDMIDEADLEHEVEFFHCERCGVWFDEFGNVEECP